VNAVTRRVRWRPPLDPQEDLLDHVVDVGLAHAFGHERPQLGLELAPGAVAGEVGGLGRVDHRALG